MKIDVGLIRDIKNINTSIDFSNKIKFNNDIIEIEPCFIKGTLAIEHEELFVNLQIKVAMILASSRSLKPVNYDLSFTLDLIFGNSKDADYKLTKEIELGEIIYGHILLEKPLTIYLEDEVEIPVVKQKKKLNPAFKDLAEFK